MICFGDWVAYVGEGEKWGHVWMGGKSRGVRVGGVTKGVSWGVRGGAGELCVCGGIRVMRGDGVRGWCVRGGGGGGWGHVWGVGRGGDSELVGVYGG